MVHITAIIEKGAKLHPSVEVGAYAYIGSRAKIGEGSVVMHHATVDGNTTMGKNNRVHPYSYVGGQTQDLKYKGGDPELLIGDDNNFREFCSIHCGTTEEIATRIGDHNLFLTYSHVAHDCQLGNDIILSGGATLARHIIVDDHAIISGFSAVHQFVHIGQYAILGGGSALVKDVPPFMMAAGNHASLVGINKVGLERNGFTQEEIEDAFRAFKIFHRGHTFENLPKYLTEQLTKDGRILKAFLEFMPTAKRGLVTGGKG